MRPEEIETLIRRRDEALNRRDAVAFAALYADDCIVDSPSFGTLMGRAAVENSMRNWFNTFSHFTMDSVGLSITEDLVVQQLVAEGTDIGGFLGQGPTGKPFRLFLVSLFTVNDRLIVHERRVYDSTGLLLQLADDRGNAAQTAQTIYRNALERTREQHELKTAAEIQRALLPEPKHCGEGIDVSATSLPCRAIGGDFFDYFEIPGGAFGFALGDIAGKGPPAALLAAQVQGVLAAQARLTVTPAETMSCVNHVLARRLLESRFATMLYGVLQPDGCLTYSNAGHNPPFLLGRCGVRRLESGGLILGAFKDTTFEQETLRLDPGDVLVAFSDGVTEALNADGEEFGEERLIACVTANKDAPPSVVLECILDRVRRFAGGSEQNDDLTALVLRFAGEQTATA